MDWQKALGLTVLAACVSVVGTLIALVLKEVVFARLFEQWKSDRSAKAALDALVAPMSQVACELLIRLHEVYQEYPTNYLNDDALKTPSYALQANDNSDPHFRHYKFVSTLYRFCAFWAWVEHFRRQVVLVQTSQSSKIARIENALDHLRADVADGKLNQHEDWHLWHDRLIFRDELRGIGERMITAPPHQGVIGYAAFSDLLSDGQNKQWVSVCEQFFLNLRPSKDFRKERIYRLIAHLHQFLSMLDKAPIPNFVRDTRSRYQIESPA